MRTSTRVELELFDITAKRDSTASSKDAQPWGNLAEDLRLEECTTQPQYGTLEHRQFLMDGSFTLFPDEPQGRFWGLWSKQQSGPDGRFAVPPVLEVNFSQPHSSAGITLHFYPLTQDWASTVEIQWYGTEGQLLDSAAFQPDAADYYCRLKVENYQRLRISFSATNKPGRYLKLEGLDYGAALTFQGEDVVQANLLEEVDPLSGEISINTLDLTLFNRSGEFSILNPDGVFDVLQDKQRITVWEDVRPSARSREVVSHNMGTFYLSDWENTSDTMAKFSATDAVGLLDSDPFDGGVYDTTAGALAAEILDGYAYELDPVLAVESVKGYLPAGTRRDALQQLAFALGAMVDCSRSNKIKICPPPNRPSSLIGRDRKFTDSEVSLHALVTEVSVTAHQYQLQEKREQLYKSDLAEGTHRIALSGPVDNLQAEGGTLLDWGNNFAVVKVTAAGQVIITGNRYADTQTVLHRQADGLPPNVKTNGKSVKDATLVSPDRADAVAQRILRYYANRCEQTFEMVAGAEKLADVLMVESFRRENVCGVLQKMELDLTGGFLASVTVLGHPVQHPAQLYVNEIYVGEEVLL